MYLLFRNFDMLQECQDIGDRISECVVRRYSKVKNYIENRAVFIFRLGNVAFATNPFELYVDFGYRIKAHCKAKQAFIIQLSSNAKGGYLPTHAAVEGGSYGSKPVSTLVGPEGGDELVEKMIEAINSLW